MRIFGLKKRNYLRNTERCEQPCIGKMINGQALGAVSKLRYGLCPMSFNGCEVIAVHNALIHAGNPRPLAEIALYMERYKLFFGIFGCNPYRIGRALEHFGTDCRRTPNADSAQAFIITFWTGRPFLSSIHTVFCVRESNCVRVYNQYNTSADSTVYPTVSDIAGTRRPIVVYEVSYNIR